MIVQIYLSTNSCTTFKLVSNVRGIVRCEKAKTVYNTKKVNLLKVDFETSDVDLNTILKYYLKSLDNKDEACIYYLDNLNLENRYNIEAKRLTKVSTINDEKWENESNDINLDKEIDRYDRYDKPLTMAFPNRMNFLLLFLLGFGIILINEMFYIIPLLSLSKPGADFNELLTSYEGFIALASKILSTALIIIFFNDILSFDIKRIKVGKYLIICLVGFILIYLDGKLFDEVIYKIFKINSEAVNEENVISVLKGKSGIAYSISVVLFTPFVEEMVFRKFAYSAFKYLKLPKWMTVLFTAIVFALIHCLTEDFTSLSSWIFFIQYFSLSLIITLVYTFTSENIYASTLTHMLNNILGLWMM